MPKSSDHRIGDTAPRFALRNRGDASSPFVESRGAAGDLKLAEISDAAASLEPLLQLSADGVFIKDTESRYVRVNRAMAGLLGRSRTAFVGRTDTEMFGEKKAAFTRGLEIRVLQGETVEAHCDAIAENFPGTLLIRETPLRAANGRIVGICGIARDITLSEQPKKRIDGMEEYLRTVFESAPDACYICDTQGNLLDGNKAAEKLIGYERNELIGKNLLKLNLLPPKCLPRAAKDLLMGSLDRSTGPDEYTLIRKDGSRVDVEIHSQPVVIGTQRVILGIARDLSRRKGSAKKVAGAQYMEISQTSVRGVAHDFNNLLYCILGYANLALSEATPSSEMKAHIREIISGTDRAASLVGRLLSCGIPDASERTQVALQPLLDEVLTFLHPSVSSGIDIEKTLDPKCGPIDAIPTEIYRVILNLCTNALRAMSQTGGVLRLGLSSCSVTPSNTARYGSLLPGEYLRLAVVDTGPGMDERTLQRVFEPYFTTRPDGYGAGLGLSIAHSIVSQLGGTILASSEVGQGTEFRVLLPLSQTFQKEEVR